jgi:tetratricopeptide (TPR) repeat protein
MNHLQDSGRRKIAAVKESILRERLWLLIIFLLAFSIRVCYLLEIEDNLYFNNPIIDSQMYDQWALQIINGGEMTEEIYWQAPLYPYFLSLIYQIFSHDYFIVRIIQFFLGSLNCLLLFFVAKKLYPHIAKISALIAVFYGPFIFFEGELLAPVIIVTLYLLFILTLLYADQYQKKALWFFSGFLNGLAAIAHGIAITLLPFIIGWIYFRYKGEGRFQRTAGRIGFFVVGCLIVVGLTMIRNYRVGHEFVSISYNAGLNFYIGNNPEYDYTVGIRPGIIYDSLFSQPERMGIKGASAHSYFFFRKSLLFICNEPLSYLKLLCKKTLLFFNGNEILRNQDIYPFRRFSAILSFLVWKNILAFPLGILWPLSLMGVVVSFKEREKFFLLYLLSSAHFIGTVMFFICSRYRIPLIPILIIFASYFIWIVYRELLSKKYKTLFFYLLIFLLLTTICNYKVGTMNIEDSKDSYYCLGSQFSERGQLEGAIKYLKKALTLDPNYADAHLNLGVVYDKQRRWEEAISEFKKSIEINAYCENCYYNLGIIYEKQGRMDEAISEYKKVIDTNPNHANALYKLGEAYTEKGKFDEAISEQKKVLTIDRNFVEAYTNLGAFYGRKGMVDEAISEFKKALTINPNFAYAHNNLAIAYYKKGNSRLAIVHCDKALVLGYSVNPKLLELLKPYR